MTVDHHALANDQNPKSESRHEREWRLVLAAKKLVEDIQRGNTAEGTDWTAYYDLYMFLAEWAERKARKKARLWGIGNNNASICFDDFYGSVTEYLSANLEQLLLRFEPELGILFTTFIRHGVNGAMARYYAKAIEEGVGYSEAMRRLHNRVIKAIDGLEACGISREEITPEMVAEKLVEEGPNNIEVAKVKTCMERMRDSKSLDADWGGEDGDGSTGYDVVPGETPDLDNYELWDMLAVMRYCAESRPGFLGLDGDAGADEIAVLRARMIWDRGAFRSERPWDEACCLLNAARTESQQQPITTANARQRASRCLSRLTLAYRILTDTDRTAEEFLAACENENALRRCSRQPRLNLTADDVANFRKAYSEWARKHRGCDFSETNPFGDE